MTTPDALPDLRTAIENLTSWPRVSWFAYDAQIRGVPVNPTEDRVVIDRDAVLGLIPPGAVLVTDADVKALAHGLEVLHSPHFGWGCNSANCSGQQAIDLIARLRGHPGIRGGPPVTIDRTNLELRADGEPRGHIRIRTPDDAPARWTAWGDLVPGYPYTYSSGDVAVTVDWDASIRVPPSHSPVAVAYAVIALSGFVVGLVVGLVVGRA